MAVHSSQPYQSYQIDCALCVILAPFAVKEIIGFLDSLLIKCRPAEL